MSRGTNKSKKRNAILTFAAGFLLCHVRAADAADRRFFRAWSFFAVSQRRRGHCADESASLHLSSQRN